MVQWMKITGLSAILAAGVVTAFGDTGRAATAPSKLFHDRLPSSTDIPEVRPETRSRAAALPRPIVASRLEKETVGALGPRLIAPLRRGPTSQPRA